MKSNKKTGQHETQEIHFAFWSGLSKWLQVWRSYEKSSVIKEGHNFLLSKDNYV